MADHSGQVCFWSREKKFGKVVEDRDGDVLWFFLADVLTPDEIKEGVRVEYDLCEYSQKNQLRRKAIHVHVLPPLTISDPQPKVVFRARAAKTAPPTPSAEFGQKLVNVPPQKSFYRI